LVPGVAHLHKPTKKKGKMKKKLSDFIEVIASDPKLKAAIEERIVKELTSTDVQKKDKQSETDEAV